MFLQKVLDIELILWRKTISKNNMLYSDMYSLH